MTRGFSGRKVRFMHGYPQGTQLRMPSRLIRSDLLDSERYNSVSTTERLCYVHLLLSADDFGNMEASTARLARVWYGCFQNVAQEQVDSALERLEKADLIRRYEVDGRKLLHIPRFNQRLRHVKRKNPASPWESADGNNLLDQPVRAKVVENRRQIAADCRKKRPEVEVEVEVEVKTNPPPPPPPENRVEPDGSELSFSATNGDYRPPEWLPAGAWRDFREMRKRLRKPMTQKAEQLMIAKLDRMRSEGEDPTAVLEQSTLCSWTSIYPVDKHGRVANTPHWWTTESGTLEQGKALGLSPRGAESWPEFRSRIRAKLAEQGQGR